MGRRLAAAGRMMLVTLVAGMARAAGQFDGTFTPASVVPTAPDRVSFLGSFALQPGGEIVTGGSIGDISIRDFLLVRVTSTGAFDPSCGTDGFVRHSIGASEGFGDVAVQPDGKIVAVGGTGDGSSASTRPS
jgi:hypothetical protein